MKRLLPAFKEALLVATPDFKQNTAIRKHFKLTYRSARLILPKALVFGMTLEMPFADHNDRPDVREGWSPGRSHSLGADCLEAVSLILDDLR